MKSLSKSLRLDYLQYKELLQMTQLRTSGISKEAENKLKRGEAINQLIVQDKNRPVSLEEQIIFLYALSKGMLDNLTSMKVKEFKRVILNFVNMQYPEYSGVIRETKELSDGVKQKLEQVLQEYFK
jgi:F-type H+-transporting ATPase subunit alpha